MQESFKKALKGYQVFRDRYVLGDRSVMQGLSLYGQQPKIMVVACCDSRVDPALLLQCDPGDLFVVRNVANIVPPYEKDHLHHGTSAALEFGICSLQVEHLIVLGHSQCGGIKMLINNGSSIPNDFITNWVSLIKSDDVAVHDTDEYAKIGLKKSYNNCQTFPWLTQKAGRGKLIIHLWFFDIKTGQIFTYDEREDSYKALNASDPDAR